MGDQQGEREKQLSKGITSFIHQTCCGIMDLTKHLLSDEGYHDYVCLGEFTTDLLEKIILQISSKDPEAYFINVQQVAEKFRIQRAKLEIALNNELVSSSEPSTHHCQNCDCVLNNGESNCLINCDL